MSAKAAPSFRIEVAALRAALKDVAGAVESRNTIPILANLLLRVDHGALTLTGTDMDLWVERRQAIESDAVFATTVQASLLERIAGKLPAEATVMATLADGKLTLSAGRARFVLPTLPSDDFIAMADADWAAEFEMPAIVLAGALDRVRHAMSSEETRYYLNGIYVHAVGSELRFAATDGHRLARMVVPAPDGAGEVPGSILSRKLIKVLLPLLDRHQGSVDVAVGGNRVRVDLGATVILAKLIDGTFPDYERVIPAAPAHRLAIDRGQLAEAVGRVATIATDKVRAVKAQLDRDVLVLSCSSPENGTASEEVPCDWPSGPLTVGFNAKYLSETLSQLTADSIEVGLDDGAAPVRWRDTDTSPATLVLMPLRV